MVTQLPTAMVDRARKWWPGLEEATFNETGNTATQFAFGAPRRANAGLSSTTFTTRRVHANGLEATVTGRVGITATALYGFGTPLDIVAPANWVGVVPVLTLNGSTESMDTPDAAYWTRALAVCSVGIWVKPAAVNAIEDLIGKYDVTTGNTAREWRLYLDASGYINWEIWDETAAKMEAGQYQTALVAGQWVHIVATYNGGAAGGGDVAVFVNGSSVTLSNTSTAVFTTMRDTASLVRVGCSMGASARTGFLNGAIAGGPLGPWFAQAQLTAAQAKNLYLLGADALGL